MSIFVEDQFQITIKFSYVTTQEGRVTGVRVLPLNAEGESVNTLICDASGRDFDTMSQILEDATIINHITGKPIVRNRVLSRLIILRFLRNFRDESNNPIAITPESIGKIHYDIVRALARSWLTQTSSKGEKR